MPDPTDRPCVQAHPDARRALVAVDHDDHARPWELCVVALEGPWA